MQKEDCFYLGRIVKKHSFKGEVVIKCDNDFIEIFQELESVWLETQNHLVPFFIEKNKQTGPNYFRLKLDGVNSEQEALNLIKSPVYLPKNELPDDFEDHLLKQDFVGFSVIDKTEGIVGNVLAVNDSTPQLLLEVDNGQKIIFIPLHEDLIIAIDQGQKEITLDLPEGLLDL